MSQGDDGESPGKALDDALAQLKESAAAAMAAIELTPEPNRAFEQATALRATVDELVGDAADLRARMAARIYESEKLSLAGLANRIGVSKARADQLIRSAKSSPQGKVDQDG
ncbi:hypothetical protein [Micromonospora sp. CA-111912]|uniref:hypothetical protein n=1 Tax=Micromonospora sp. CA-111912 TaxID=3239955 RepID=UPI003D9021D0